MAYPHFSGAFVLQRPVCVSLLLGLVTLLVFLPAVQGDFVNFDDGPYVAENPWVLEGLSMQGLLRACTEIVCANWSPLTMLSYQLDATLYGSSPWGFHLTNVLLHATATGLLYVVLSRMTGQPGRSAAATLLFAVHPLRVESVAWIAERKDVLCQVFLMLALIAYERYCRKPVIFRYSSVMVAMVLGLLCKPTLVSLPALLLLLDAWPLGRIDIPGRYRQEPAGRTASPYPPRSWLAIATEKIPLCLVSVVFIAITLASQRVALRGGIEKPFFTCRVPNALYAIIWYVTSLFWPTRLCLMRRHVGDELSASAVMVCALAIVAVLSAVIFNARRQPWLPWGVAWLLVAVLPMLGLVQVGEQGYADRYSYVPHVGLAVAVVWALSHLADRLRIPTWVRATSTGLAALALVAVTEQQVATWRNSRTLWTHALTVDPRITMAHTKLAAMLLDEGNILEAKRHYLVAFETSDGAAGVCARLAGVHFDLGEFAEARRLRDRAIAITPDADATRWIVKKMRTGPSQTVPTEVKATIRDGLAEAKAGRTALALGFFEQAVRAAPDCADAHNNVGMALAQLGRPTEAAEAFGRAVTINPLHADYRLNFALALHRLHRQQEAFLHCQAALDCDPTDTAIKAFHNELLGENREP